MAVISFADLEKPTDVMRTFPGRNEMTKEFDLSAPSEQVSKSIVLLVGCNCVTFLSPVEFPVLHRRAPFLLIDEFPVFNR